MEEMILNVAYIITNETNSFYMNLVSLQSLFEKNKDNKINLYIIYEKNIEQQKLNKISKYKEYANCLNINLIESNIEQYNNLKSEINFDKLPNRVVFKNTISGGGVGIKIIKDLSIQNIDNLKYELNNLLFKWDFVGSVPQRRLIKERLIAEKYIEDVDKCASDFKFFCFDGKVEFFYLANNFANNKNKKLSYYDMNLKRLDINYDGYDVANIETTYHFDKMVEIVSKLSKGFPIVRIDFYDTKEKFYIGEMTFYPRGGVGKYSPIDWDLKLGKFINLENINKNFLI